MKYNAILSKKYKLEPIKVILELDIPNHLSDDDRYIYAAKKLMNDYKVELEPIRTESSLDQ